MFDTIDIDKNWFKVKLNSDLIVNLQQQLEERTKKSDTELRNMVTIFDPRTKYDVSDDVWERLPEWMDPFITKEENVEAPTPVRMI